MNIDSEDLAQSLVQARKTRQPLPRPKDLSKEQAAQVKHRTLELLSDNGRLRTVGYKVSMSGTWGALTEDFVLQGHATLERQQLFDPLVETEAVFRLLCDITPQHSIEEILRHTEVNVGLEIADCRWQGWAPGQSEHQARGIPSRELIEADNALSGWLVLGDQWVAANSLPLPNVEVAAYGNGAPLAKGSLTEVMGHPAAVIRWLAQALDSAGMTLRAGDLVATGNSYPDVITVPDHGGEYEARIDGISYATLTIR